MTSQNSIKVVVAEDDFLVRKMIIKAIESIGLEIVGLAANGAEAIEMVTSLKPDVVLMDIQMPSVDGLEATRQIQKSCPVPVVILTAHETQDLVTKASEVGAGAYLVKPPSAQDIERSITIAMARHEDLMKLRELYQKVESQNKELERALAENKILQGIIPICMFCKQIRDGEGYWNQVEKYISEHSDAKFSHSICEKCIKKHYPEIEIKK